MAHTVLTALNLIEILKIARKLGILMLIHEFLELEIQYIIFIFYFFVITMLHALLERLMPAMLDFQSISPPGNLSIKVYYIPNLNYRI